MKRDTGIDFQVRIVSHEAWTFAGTHNVYFDNKVSLSASIQHTTNHRVLIIYVI